MKPLPTLLFAILGLLSGTVAPAADKPHAVIVVGTHHYSPQQSMPKFAVELERLGFETTVINPDWDPEKDKRGLPGLEALENADVGIFFVRFLKLEDEQLSHITKFVESGKPVVCFRTSTHAFNYPIDHPQQDLNLSFGREVFGTPYLIHLQGQTQVEPVEGVGDHPILTGVKSTEWISPGTLYLTKLEPGAKPLLRGTGRPAKAGVRTNAFGTHDLKEEMSDTIAWTWENQWGGRVFGTSLGHTGDFEVPESMRIMVNGVFWAAGESVPSADTEIKTLGNAPPVASQEKLPASSPKDPTLWFYGSSMVERLLEHGELEACLQIAQAGADLKIRSLAGIGDEAGNRLRLEGYAKHMKKLIAEALSGPPEIDPEHLQAVALTASAKPERVAEVVRYHEMNHLTNAVVHQLAAQPGKAFSEMESKVEPGSKGAVFELEIPAGKTELVTYLYDESGKAGGAYPTEVDAL